MSHGEDDDDPQLKSLRAVWLSMPDEDPPGRGLDALMAAARVKATEMAGTADAAAPSWWQRVFSALRRPPVLALATVIVLLAGAVIIGNRHDKLDATAPPNAGGPSPEDVSTQGHVTEHKDEAPPPVQPPREDRKERGGRAVQQATPRDEESTARETEGTGTNAASATADTTTSGPATTDSPVEHPKAQTTATVTAKHKAGHAAAGRDDCSAVRSKLQTLKAAQAQSYRNQVASDPSLARCLAPAGEAATSMPAE